MHNNMKRILYILAFMLTVGMGASAQTLIERSDGTFTQGDQYLAALKTLSIPYGVAPTFDGGLARNGSLFFNTTTNKLVVWTGEAWEDVGKETDLSDYYNKSEVNALIAPFATTSDLNAALLLKVDKSTTVNGKTLSGNIVIEQSDIPGLVAALAAKQNTVTGAASTVVDNNLTANRAVISNGSGKIAASPVTANELSYLGGVTSSVQAQLNDKIAITQKGANNGVAPLNSSGKIPAQYVDVTTMEYMGTWNASTNVPVLSDATGSGGQYYRVTVGGTRNLGSGSITFTAGDDVIHNGTIWQRVPSTQLVTSVNGQTGNIVLGKADVGLGNVDNTADLAKPISNATQTALDGKANASHTHNASDINAGTLNIARIPTGTTSSTVALGNDARINNGQTAFDWGDWRQGFANMPNETDPNSLLYRQTSSNSSADFGNYPIRYSSVVSLNATTGRGFQIANYYGNGNMYFLRNYNTNSSNWTSWVEIHHSANSFNTTQSDARYLKLTGGTVSGTITAATAPTAGGHLTNKTYVDNAISTANAASATKLATARTINGTAFDGTANITTARWGTARTLTIGNTGKSVNGSGNVSWSLAEIGALPLTGGTVTGVIKSPAPVDNEDLANKEYVDSFIPEVIKETFVIGDLGGNSYVAETIPYPTGYYLLPQGANISVGTNPGSLVSNDDLTYAVNEDSVRFQYAAGHGVAIGRNLNIYFLKVRK